MKYSIIIMLGIILIPQSSVGQSVDVPDKTLEQLVSFVTAIDNKSIDPKTGMRYCREDQSPIEYRAGRKVTICARMSIERQKEIVSNFFRAAASVKRGGLSEAAFDKLQLCNAVYKREDWQNSKLFCKQAANLGSSDGALLYVAALKSAGDIPETDTPESLVRIKKIAAYFNYWAMNESKTFETGAKISSYVLYHAARFNITHNINRDLAADFLHTAYRAARDNNDICVRTRAAQELLALRDFGVRRAQNFIPPSVVDGSMELRQDFTKSPQIGCEDANPDIKHGNLSVDKSRILNVLRGPIKISVYIDPDHSGELICLVSKDGQDQVYAITDSICNIVHNTYVAKYAINTKGEDQPFIFTVDSSKLDGASILLKMISYIENDQLNDQLIDKGNNGLNKMRLPAPKGRISEWISYADVPSSLWNVNQHGLSKVRLTIAVDGKVSDCMITNSSGSVELDNITCALMQRRGRFLPGTDNSGAPVVSYYDSEVQW